MYAGVCYFKNLDCKNNLGQSSRVSTSTFLKEKGEVSVDEQEKYVKLRKSQRKPEQNRND